MSSKGGNSFAITDNKDNGQEWCHVGEEEKRSLEGLHYFRGLKISSQTEDILLRALVVGDYIVRQTKKRIHEVWEYSAVICLCVAHTVDGMYVM